MDDSPAVDAHGVFHGNIWHFCQYSSDGLPYPIFTYTALLPWHYFSAISRSGDSLVSSANLISKVYFRGSLCLLQPR